MTDYPNREHENADKAARRRALNALNDIEGEVAYLRLRIAGDLADGDDTSTVAQRTTDVTRQLAILGALREVREWHAADAREAQADAANHGEDCGCGLGATRCRAAEDGDFGG